MPPSRSHKRQAGLSPSLDQPVFGGRMPGLSQGLLRLLISSSAIAAMLVSLPAGAKDAPAVSKDKPAASKDKPAAGSPEKTVMGWRLAQASQVHGPIDCYIGSIGLRLQMKEIAIISSSPKFQISFVNASNKRYMAQDAVLARKKTEWGASPPGEVTFEKATGKDATSKIAGFNATKYTRKVKLKDGRVVTTGEMWVTKDMGLPPATHDAIVRMLNCPPALGMPLRLHGKTPRGVREVYMDTYEAKRFPLTRSLFECPKGYKPVKDEMALILESDEGGGRGRGDDDMSSLFRSPK